MVNNKIGKGMESNIYTPIATVVLSRINVLAPSLIVCARLSVTYLQGFLKNFKQLITFKMSNCVVCSLQILLTLRWKIESCHLTTSLSEKCNHSLQIAFIRLKYLNWWV